MSKLLVILGPTATGKSALAIALAEKYRGEVISADSRQVYKGLDIGTNKVTPPEMRGIPHHLIDIVAPTERFSVQQFKTSAETGIADIISRGNLPIVCGGTGFYIQSLVDGVSLPEVQPDPVLRRHLETESTESLFKKLAVLDPERASHIDPHNKVRLIRAVEIITALGKTPPLAIHKAPHDILEIGLDLPDDILRKRIEDRTKLRIEKGLIEEARNLHQQGLALMRMRELGLEYGALADFLEERCTQDELVKRINLETWHYVKRQRTWFKRDKRIIWCDPREESRILEVVGNWRAVPRRSSYSSEGGR